MCKSGFKITRIRIDKFRNLDHLKPLEFSSRINVISGQNGVGKSNILALIASGTGSQSKHRMTGENFRPQFEQFFNIYPDEVSEEKQDDPNRYLVYTDYERELDHVTITKRLSLKKNTRNGNNRVQIIPRTFISDAQFKNIWKKRGFTKKSDVLKELVQEHVSKDGRIDIPTSFVSVSRVYPLGEINNIDKPTNKAEIINIRGNNQLIANSINEKFREFYNQVLPGSIDNDKDSGYMVQKRNVLHKQYSRRINNTQPLSRSVGQDSLTVIINSILDFVNEKISNPSDYIGGILCIDEIDISLHPAAQKKLWDLLKEIAKEYDLQIFLTTHSMTLLEIAARDCSRRPDDYSINYLRDRYNPRLLPQPTIENIKEDMFMEGKIIPQKVKMYFEDDESLIIYKMLLKAAELDDDIKTPGELRTEIIISHAGKDFLKTISNQDPYFNSVIIVLDSDGRFSGKETSKNPLYVNEYLTEEYQAKVSGHTDVKLPPNVLHFPGYFAPESMIYRLLQRYSVSTNDAELKAEQNAFWTHVDDLEINEPITSQFIQQNFKVENEHATNDDIKKDSIHEQFEFAKRTDIVAFYYNYNVERQTELKRFFKDLNSLILITAKKMASVKF